MATEISLLALAGNTRHSLPINKRIGSVAFSPAMEVNGNRITQSADGPATILAIGTANPTNVVDQNAYPDFYFRVTNSEHLQELKAKFRRLCKIFVVRSSACNSNRMIFEYVWFGGF